MHFENNKGALMNKISLQTVQIWLELVAMKWTPFAINLGGSQTSYYSAQNLKMNPQSG